MMITSLLVAVTLSGAAHADLPPGVGAILPPDPPVLRGLPGPQYNPATGRWEEQESDFSSMRGDGSDLERVEWVGATARSRSEREYGEYAEACGDTGRPQGSGEEQLRRSRCGELRRRMAEDAIDGFLQRLGVDLSGFGEDEGGSGGGAGGGGASGGGNFFERAYHFVRERCADVGARPYITGERIGGENYVLVGCRARW